MRIGIDVRLLGKKRTGDETVFFNLVKNLAEIDSENQYFLFIDRDPKQNKEVADEIKKLKLKENYHLVFINSPNRFWWNLLAIQIYLRKNPIDIFHTQYIAPFWIPKKVKLVLTIHDISFNFFSEFIKFSDLFFLKTLIPRSLKMAAKIIAVSQFTKNEIEKYYKISAKKISAVQNGVDFEMFNQPIQTNKLEEIRHKYDLPKDFILYLGTLQPRKNIPMLIEAFQILLYKYDLKNCKLVIAGNRKAHNFDPRIDGIIEKNYLRESVIFPGWIDEEDKPALFKLAGCFAFPSLYEGFGIPIAEAMAAGTPVASSDQEALVEVGKDAILSSKRDIPEMMAENIHRILTDEKLRKNLIEKGIERAKKFTWRKNAEELLEIYEHLLK